MMQCADEVVVGADHTKVGRQALAFLCELSEIDALVIDERLTAEQRELIDQSKTQLVLAPMPEEAQAS